MGRGSRWWPLHLATVLLSALLPAACASSLGEWPGLAGTRQILLLKRLPPTGSYSSEGQMVAANASGATDRFSAQQPKGYLLVVFSNANSHALKFAIRRQNGDTAYDKSVTLGAHPSWSSFRGHIEDFPIQGSLTPGPYRLDLTIDNSAAGSYPFAVE